MTDLLRIPPQNLDAEQAVLGSMIIDVEQIPGIIATLNADMFYKESHGILFNAIMLLHLQGDPVDIVTLTNYLRVTDEHDRTGGTAYYATLADGVPTPKNARKYAKIVYEKFALRELIKKCNTVIVDAYKHHERETPAIEQIATAGKYILDLAGADPFAEGKTVKILCKELIHRMDEVKKTGILPGIKTGFPELDATLRGGWRCGWLILLCGDSGEGKTSLALQFGDEAERAGHKPLYYSMEMSDSELLERLIIQRARIDAGYLIDQKGDAGDTAAFQHTVKGIYKGGWTFRGGAGMTATRLGGTLRTELINTGSDFLIVENAQLVQQDRDESKPLAVEAVAVQCKSIAAEFHIPVILESHLNEAGEEKWARALRENSDVIMKLYRKDKTPNQDYYNTELRITKHRFGARRKINLTFEAKYCSFYESKDQGGEA